MNGARCASHAACHSSASPPGPQDVGGNAANQAGKTEPKKDLQKGEQSYGVGPLWQRVLLVALATV